MEQSAAKVQLMKSFLINIEQATETYSRNLKEIAESFSRDISKNNEEHDILVYCYNYICHFMLNISHHHSNVASNIHNKIIEPFELFSDNFTETNTNLLNNTNRILTNLEGSYGDMLRKQETHYRYAKKYDKFIKENEYVLKKIEKGDISKEELNFFSYDSLMHKSNADKSMSEYKSSISTVNQRWENYDSEFFTIFENFDLNEESRVHFTKLNVSQIIKSMNELHGDITAAFQDYNAVAFEKKTKEMEDKLDTKRLSASKSVHKETMNNIGRPMIKREEYVNYDTYKRRKHATSEDSSYSNKENLANPHKNPERQPLDNIIALLTKEPTHQAHVNSTRVERAKSMPIAPTHSTDVSMEEDVLTFMNQNKLGQLFSNPQVRKYFLEKINNSPNSKSFTITEEKWPILNQIATCLIQGILTCKDKEAESFHSLISFLMRFSKEDEKLKKRRFLCSSFKTSVIWEDVARWENLIYYLFHKKKLEEYNKQSTARASAEADFPAVKGFMIGLFGGKKDDNSPDKTVVDESVIKLQVLDEINIFILHIDMDPNVASNILLSIANKLEIDEIALQNLKRLLEKKNNTSLRRKLQSRSHDHVKKHKKHGNLFAIRLAMDFLSPRDNLLSLLLVNKKWKRCLEDIVYKIALSVPDDRIGLVYRLNVWLSILKVHHMNIDYFMLKEKHNLHEQKIYQVEDIITLDVQRSFHNHPNISPMILHGLLRLYAHYNPEVSYCQGMNFVMGFIYCLYESEEVTFKIFAGMMNKFMKNIFENDLTHLRLIFYQYDRLVGIFLPDLADHFHREKIDSSLYTSPWFITVFTSVFQFTQQSYMLFRVWDTFLVDGWKGFFKICLAILDTFKETLLRLRFDQILGFMNDLVRHEMFCNVKYAEYLRYKGFRLFDKESDIPEEFAHIQTFSKKMEKFAITKSLLRILETEYLEIQDPLETDRLNNMKQKSKDGYPVRKFY
jgi:hypothetical protein